MKGRSVFDAMRIIDDILDFFAEITSRSGTGSLVASDFEKTF